jgi:hypothetical protein
MNSEDRPYLQRGDVPSCTITHEDGWDTPDGRRIDRYAGADGYAYEREIPAGGGFCPELQGTVQGREPVWRRLGRHPGGFTIRSRLGTL